MYEARICIFICGNISIYIWHLSVLINSQQVLNDSAGPAKSDSIRLV